MKKTLKAGAAFILLVSMLLTYQSCKMVKEVTETIANIKKLQFKLESVSRFNVAGVDISSKKSVSDFSTMDALKLTRLVTSNKLPVSFTLNVAAKNPNDGSGKGRKTTATLTSFDWNLYIDDVKTVNGNIEKPIEIPGTGQSSIIPLTVSMDLYEFFGKRGYDGLLNLALAIGGVNGSPARLKLDARPRVSTPYGDINYPGRLTIVDKIWN